MDINEQDREVLEFEKQLWKYEGAKIAAILEQFGWTATRYYQRLNAIIDKPEALAFDPLLVNRLRRLRNDRLLRRRLS